jgi:alkylation response protein AidB-like acyl-CoA dehydrogenase
MDFAFSDDQVELRRAVRLVLDAECTPSALRALADASPDGRAALSRARWAVLSALGAPALLVPETAGGLGLRDTDLVTVFEEAGWAALPEPLLETAGLAAPLLATLLPAPTAAGALDALLERHATFAVGGVDVTATEPVSPTRAGSCTPCRPARAASSPRRRWTPPAISRPCTGPSRPTPCWPTAWPPRRWCSCWPTGPPPARPPT